MAHLAIKQSMKLTSLLDTKLFSENAYGHYL